VTLNASSTGVETYKGWGTRTGLAPLTFVCKTISRNETYLSVLVEDEAEFSPALLAYLPVVAFNIESLAVGPAEQEESPELRWLFPGVIEQQLTKQLQASQRSQGAGHY